MASIDVKLNSNYANNDSLQTISVSLEKNKIVHEIYYQKNLIESLNSNIRKIFIFFLLQLNLIFYCFCIN